MSQVKALGQYMTPDWAAEALGGRADLQRIYREVEGHRPTSNTWWQAKVRQQLQRIARRVDAGVWELAPPSNHNLNTAQGADRIAA